MGQNKASNRSAAAAKFALAADMLSNAKTGAEKRRAAHTWLIAAIWDAGTNGLEVSPAIALASALEGLDVGSTDPMLRPPDGLPHGRQPEAPARVAIKALALAAIEALHKTGIDIKSAISIVSEELGDNPDSLQNLRKKVNVERAKPAKKRKKYLDLLGDGITPGLLDDEIERLSGLSLHPEGRNLIYQDLIWTSKLLGMKRGL